MSSNPEINYKEFYENDGKRLNFWNIDKKTLTYGREYLRYSKIAKHLRNHKLNILDLGCGDGYLSCMLGEMGHKVDAMDISTERLKKFAKQAEKLGITQICGSVYEYNFTKTYDVVILSEIIEHLENYNQIVAKAYEITKPGGVVLIAVPYKEDIKLCKCPYCLKDFNEYGHIHSFDQGVVQNMAKQLKASVSFIETFNNKYSSYLYRLTPIKSYTVYRFEDSLLSSLMKQKNTHMLFGLKKE